MSAGRQFPAPESWLLLVDVCVPNFLHAEASIAAMEAGKHVVCEKPFAQRIKYCGGGCVIHLAVHPIGFFYHLLGKPVCVFSGCSGGGKKNLVHKELEGEDWGIGVLTYSEGAEVVVKGNYITRGGMKDFVEIYGTTGGIKADLTFGNPLSVFSHDGYGHQNLRPGHASAPFSTFSFSAEIGFVHLQQWLTLVSGSLYIRTEVSLGETNRCVPGIEDKQIRY